MGAYPGDYSKCDTDTSNVGPPPILAQCKVHRPLIYKCMHKFMQISSTPTAHQTAAANQDESEIPKAQTGNTESSSSDDREGVVAEEPPNKRRKGLFSTEESDLIVTYFDLRTALKAPSMEECREFLRTDGKDMADDWTGKNIQDKV